MSDTSQTITMLQDEKNALRQRISELEQSLAQAAETIHWQQALLNTIPSPIFYKDTQGVYQGCNNAFAEMLGKDHAQIVGKTVYEISPGDLAETYHQADIELIRKQKSQTYETQVQFADNTRHPVIIRKAVLHDTAGQPAGLIGLLLDITERKQIELELEQRVAEHTVALRQSQTLLQGILDHTPAVIYVKDTQGHYLLVNHTFENLFHLTSEQIIGQTDQDIFPPEAAQQNRVNDIAVANAGQAVESEEQIPVDGELRTYLSFKFPLRDKQGALYGTAGISTDITERKQQEEALQLRQHALDNASDMVQLFDPNGRIVYVNDAVCRNLDYTRDELLTKALYDLDPNFPAEMWPTLWKQVQETGIIGLETVQLRKDGSTIPIEVAGTYCEIDDKQFGIAFLRDLTERKRQEAERAALQQQVIDAQRDALRELSTPLIPITNTVMIMPLIGTIDSGRAQQVMEALLEGVARQQAELVILDITGVSVVDTQVAQSFIQAAQAVNLLGAQVMLTGIQPQIAQTLVMLGIDLSGIVTRGSLQSGIAYALNGRVSQ